ncbi:ABC transporter permease [Planosporangium sp. 12N6]|uniref:ABC transporter permease n=1 Tax=Planosporangium spinosum TaxID=3402278 RepID=UPI003CEC0693
MLGFLLRRFANYLVLIVIATSFGYLLAASTLNPRAKYDDIQPHPPEASITQALSNLNMNPADPKLERLGRWAKGIVTEGDFGRTIDNTPVNEEFGRRIWVSLRLLLIGTILGSVVGVAVGAYSAINQYRWSDHTITFMSFVVISIPVFVLAVALKQPAIGFNGLFGTDVLFIQGEYQAGGGGWSGAAIVDRIQHLVVPTLSLALGLVAFYSRYQRATMLDVLGSDFLRTARAKGLRRRRALVKHGLRTALIPMVTFFSYQFVLMFVGAIFTEKIFGWHGMGEWFIDSIGKDDINSVGAVVFFSAILVLIAGMLADLAYAALDPRVRAN